MQLPIRSVLPDQSSQLLLFCKLQLLSVNISRDTFTPPDSDAPPDSRSSGFYAKFNRPRASAVSSPQSQRIRKSPRVNGPAARPGPTQLRERARAPSESGRGRWRRARADAGAERERARAPSGAGAGAERSERGRRAERSERGRGRRAERERARAPSGASAGAGAKRWRARAPSESGPRQVRAGAGAK